MSALNASLKIILESDFRTLHTDCASPKVVITVRAFPKLKLSPIAFGSSMHRIRQSTKSST